MTKLISLFLVTCLTSHTTIINAEIPDNSLENILLSVICNSLSSLSSKEIKEKIKENIDKEIPKNNLHSLIKTYQFHASVNQDGIYELAYGGKYRDEKIDSIKRLNEMLSTIKPEDNSKKTRARLTSIANAYNHTLTSFAPDDAKIILPENFILTHNENKSDDHFANSDRKKEFSARIKSTFWQVVLGAFNKSFSISSSQKRSLENINSQESIYSAIAESQMNAWVFSSGIYGSSADLQISSIRRFEKEYSAIDPSEIDEDTKGLFTIVTKIFNETLYKDDLTKVCTFSLEPEQDEQSGSEPTNISQQQTQNAETQMLNTKC